MGSDTPILTRKRRLCIMNQQVCLVTLDDNLIGNILSITLFSASLFISLRAFSLYIQARTPRLLVLGLSMGMVALTAIASYIGDNATSITFNVKWFQYIAQTISFLFILLSLLRSTKDYQRRIVRWHIIASLLLLLLSATFLLISIGYWMAIPKYFGPGMEQVDQMGDIVRTCGLLILLIAVLQRQNPAKLGQVPFQLENPPSRA